MSTVERGNDDLAPLEEIERAVQERAKDISLEMSTDGGKEKLRGLIADEVARWSLDHRRGLRPYDLADPDVVAERAYRNLAGFGPLEPLLADDDVWEVMVNAPDSIFVRRHVGRSGYHDEVFLDDEHVVRILTKLLDDASTSHRKLDPAEGLQDAQLDTGARLHIVHGDISRGGHIMCNIRRFTGVPFRHLGELVDRGMLTTEVAAFLAACVQARLTIVFAGAPGSGKTTLLSCCAAELDPSLRVVIAEEVFEVDVPLPNVAQLQTRPARADRPAVDLRRLVAGFLRMAPDVAIVGEVRDREALPLLLTLSSGVKGFTTIHAGSARQALTRLRFICQLADTSSDLPLTALNSLVSESVDLVVHCARGVDGPRVTEVVAVEDLAAGPDAAQFTVTDLYRRSGPEAPLHWTGNLPVRAMRALRDVGHDPRVLLESHERGGGRRVVIVLLAAVAAAAGTYLLYTALVLGWTEVRRPQTGRRPRRSPVGRWLVQAGLAEVPLRELAAVIATLGVLGALVAGALFGGPLPALVAGAFAASLPIASTRARRRARRAAAMDAWPRLLEELRILTSSLGRSVPQALFEVGRRAPEEMRPAFEHARREWHLSTDFARTVRVLKDGLSDPTADAACETLLVAHEIGGTDLERRLEALIDDRIQDTQGRKDARAKQAGARFARLFVLVVPAGMALVGMSIGTGRRAYQTPSGQLLVAVAIVLVVLCWLWAGRIMTIPEEQRVFDA